MIEDLRFIRLSEPAPEFGPGISRTVRVLQAYDGHQWFTVPLVELDDETNGEKL